MYTAQSLVPADELSNCITKYLKALEGHLNSCAQERYYKPIAISTFCGKTLGNHIDEFFERPFDGPPKRLITHDKHKELLFMMESAINCRNKNTIINKKELDDFDKLYASYENSMKIWNTKINRQIFLPKANLEASLTVVRLKIRDQWRGVGMKDPETFWTFLKREIYERRAKGDFVGAMRMSYSVLNVLNNKPDEFTSDKNTLNIYKALTIFTGDWSAYIAKNHTMERFYIKKLRKLWSDMPDIQIKNRIFNTFGKHNPLSRFSFRVLETRDIQLKHSKIILYPTDISASLFNAACAALEQGADLDTPIRELMDMSPNEAFRLAWTLELAEGEFEDALFTMPKHAEWLGRYGRLTDAFKVLDQAKKIVSEHKYLHIGLRTLEVEVGLLVRIFRLSSSQRDFDVAVKAEVNLIKEYDRRRTPQNLRKNGFWK